MADFIHRGVNLKRLVGFILILAGFGVLLIHFTPPNSLDELKDPPNTPEKPGRRGPSQDNRTSHNKYIV